MRLRLNYPSGIAVSDARCLPVVKNMRLLEVVRIAILQYIVRNVRPCADNVTRAYVHRARVYALLLISYKDKICATDGRADGPASGQAS